jgi:hypothetical protein
MPQWEYQKLNLNDVPAKVDEIDLLNDAGRDGWELIVITPNKLAILKREFPLAPLANSTPRRARIAAAARE